MNFTKKPKFGLRAVTNNNGCLKCWQCNEFIHSVSNCRISKINAYSKSLLDININMNLYEGGGRIGYWATSYDICMQQYMINLHGGLRLIP